MNTEERIEDYKKQIKRLEQGINRFAVSFIVVSFALLAALVFTSSRCP
jgi:hypothetical protein